MLNLIIPAPFVAICGKTFSTTFNCTFLLVRSFQFAFTMTEEEDIIVVLTQKNTKETGGEKSVIGFTLMKVIF